MDRNQIDDVLRLTPVGCGRRSSCRKINRVKHITEKIIQLCREEPKCAVVNSFQPHAAAMVLNARVAFPAHDFFPNYLKTGVGRCCSVSVCRSFKPLLEVLKRINIFRKARPLAIERDSTRDVAVRAPF